MTRAGESYVENDAWLHLGLGRGKKPKCHLNWIKFWNNSSVLSKSVQMNWKYQIFICKQIRESDKDFNLYNMFKVLCVDL